MLTRLVDGVTLASEESRGKTCHIHSSRKNHADCDPIRADSNQRALKFDATKKRFESSHGYPNGSDNAAFPPHAQPQTYMYHHIIPTLLDSWLL